MATLKNHPGFWLRDDAAAAFDAYEDKYGVIRVSSAGRTKAEQQALIDKWNKGGKYNRPPYLYRPYMPAEGSEHVKGGGLAVDTSDFNTFRKHCEEFGFKWWGSGDPVHFYFIGWNPPAKPNKPATPVKKEKKKMSVGVIHTNEKSDRTRRGAIVDYERNRISTFGDFPVSYANGVAVGFGLDGSAPVTPGHYDKIVSDFS